MVATATTASNRSYAIPLSSVTLIFQSYVATDVFAVTYSVGDRDSFLSVRQRWLPEIRKHFSSAVIILVGTMEDLRHDAAARATLGPKYREVPLVEAEAVRFGTLCVYVSVCQCVCVRRVSVRRLTS